MWVSVTHVAAWSAPFSSCEKNVHAAKSWCLLGEFRRIKWWKAVIDSCLYTAALPEPNCLSFWSILYLAEELGERFSPTWVFYVLLTAIFVYYKKQARENYEKTHNDKTHLFAKAHNLPAQDPLSFKGLFCCLMSCVKESKRLQHRSTMHLTAQPFPGCSATDPQLLFEIKQNLQRVMKFTYLKTRFLCLPSLQQTGESCTQKILKCPNYTELRVAVKKPMTLEGTERHRGQFKDSLATELYVFWDSLKTHTNATPDP